MKICSEKRWRLLGGLLNFGVGPFLAHSSPGSQIKLIFIYVGVFHRRVLREIKVGCEEEGVFFVIFYVL